MITSQSEMQQCVNLHNKSLNLNNATFYGIISLCSQYLKELFFLKKGIVIDVTTNCRGEWNTILLDFVCDC